MENTKEGGRQTGQNTDLGIYTIKECWKCGNPEKMYWCKNCEENCETYKCDNCGGFTMIDKEYHENCNEDINMLERENKAMAEFLEKLGYTQEQIIDICNGLNVEAFKDNSPIIESEVIRTDDGDEIEQ